MEKKKKENSPRYYVLSLVIVLYTFADFGLTEQKD